MIFSEKMIFKMIWRLKEVFKSFSEIFWKNVLQVEEIFDVLEPSWKFFWNIFFGLFKRL